MPEAKVIPYEVQGNLYRYDRNSWLQAGIDDFTVAPAQNPDAFLQLTNILPPATGVLLRRFGYRFFNPALDNGANIDSDEVLNGPIPTFMTPLFSYSQTVLFGNSLLSLTTNFQPTFGTWQGNHVYQAGTSIVDSNGNVQQVVVGGTSGGITPTWGVTVGAHTIDGGVTWNAKIYAISIGDTIFIPINLNAGSVPHVTTITDSAGDTWGSITALQSIGSSGSFQVWATRVSANVPYGTPLSITLNFSAVTFSGNQLNIIQWSNLGIKTLPSVQANGTAATWSSGSISVPASTALFSASLDGNAQTPNAPWTGQETMFAYYIPGTGGTFSDSWNSNAGSTPWFSNLFAYPFQAI